MFTKFLECSGIGFQLDITQNNKTTKQQQQKRHVTNGRWNDEAVGKILNKNYVRPQDKELVAEKQELHNRIMARDTKKLYPLECKGQSWLGCKLRTKKCIGI